jgi:hypothetical protein
VTVIPSEIDIQDQALREALGELHTCMPGEVVAVRSGAADGRQFVDVLPLLQRAVVDEDGNPMNEVLPVLQMVPVGFMQGGGFFFSLPLRIGDTVLLVFAERSLDAWLETCTPGARTPSVPGDLSTHTLQGAIALPWGPAPRSALLAGVDGTDLVLGLRDGTVLARFTPAGGVVFAEGVNYVALANLVLSELNRLWTAVGAHTHVVATTGTSTAQSGTAAAAGSQGTAGPVAATKTKAT